jgi:hypothetical protein
MAPKLISDGMVCSDTNVKIWDGSSEENILNFIDKNIISRPTRKANGIEFQPTLKAGGPE